MTITFDEVDRSEIPVVILCGGMGTRLREASEKLPKPLVDIGGKPILWHIMKTYSHYGFRRFVLCLGYKSDQIRRYFLDYREHSTDFTLRAPRAGVSSGVARRRTTSRTGRSRSATRACCRAPVRESVGSPSTSTTTHSCSPTGTASANVDIPALLEQHLAAGRMGTVTGVHPGQPLRRDAHRR